jgi:hypothetical protein
LRECLLGPNLRLDQPHQRFGVQKFIEFQSFLFQQPSFPLFSQQGARALLQPLGGTVL